MEFAFIIISHVVDDYGILFIHLQLIIYNINHINSMKQKHCIKFLNSSDFLPICNLGWMNIKKMKLSQLGVKLSFLLHAFQKKKQKKKLLNDQIFSFTNHNGGYKVSQYTRNPCNC